MIPQATNKPEMIRYYVCQAGQTFIYDEEDPERASGVSIFNHTNIEQLRRSYRPLILRKAKGES